MELVCKKSRQIFSVAYYQYRNWLLSGKQIVVFFILLFLMDYVAGPLADLSKGTGLPFHWAETFLAASNSSYVIPLILLCFLTLMSEFPKRNYEDINFLFRTNRANWYYGQLIFCVFAIATFLIETGTLFFLRTIRISYLANGWSPITKHYMEKYIDIGKGYGVIAVVPSEVYHHFSPMEAFFYTMLLLACFFLECSLIMMACNLLNRKMAGVLINILFIVLGMGMIYMKSDFLMLFPLGNAVLKCHNLPVTRLVEPEHPVYYFLISNVALAAVGRILIKKVTL